MEIIRTQLVPTWREENHYRASYIEYLKKLKL
jgi:hypothetical protein